MCITAHCNTIESCHCTWDALNKWCDEQVTVGSDLSTDRTSGSYRDSCPTPSGGGAIRFAAAHAGYASMLVRRMIQEACEHLAL